jgi:RNA polymerase sigma-70 factor (ECF subfamily)
VINASKVLIVDDVPPILYTLRILLKLEGYYVHTAVGVQQAFLQLHRARADFDGGMRFKPWIITIAMNLGRDLLRRRGRWGEAIVDEERLVAPEAPVADVEEAARVRAALAQLPRDQREVIELHWFEELSFPEIAGIVGAKPGAVRVRAHRGYETLRKLLGQIG